MCERKWIYMKFLNRLHFINIHVVVDNRKENEFEETREDAKFDWFNLH